MHRSIRICQAAGWRRLIYDYCCGRRCVRICRLRFIVSLNLYWINLPIGSAGGRVRNGIIQFSLAELNAPSVA